MVVIACGWWLVELELWCVSVVQSVCCRVRLSQVGARCEVIAVMVEEEWLVGTMGAETNVVRTCDALLEDLAERRCVQPVQPAQPASVSARRTECAKERPAWPKRKAAVQPCSARLVYHTRSAATIVFSCIASPSVSSCSS